MKKMLFVVALILAVGVAMLLRNRRSGSEASWQEFADSAKDAASKVTGSVKDAVTTAGDKVVEAVDVAKEKAKGATS